MKCRKLLFWFAKDQHWVEIKYLTKFSRLEYYSTKCGSDLQKFKYDVAENLGLQISEISRQQIPPMLVSIGVQHSHLHQVLLQIPAIHTICDYITAAGQLTHRIAAISSWNFSFFLVQECMVTGWFFGSQSFFKFLTQCLSEAEICWGTFCQIRWSENGTCIYCL